MRFAVPHPAPVPAFFSDAVACEKRMFHPSDARKPVAWEIALFTKHPDCWREKRHAPFSPRTTKNQPWSTKQANPIPETRGLVGQRTQQSRPRMRGFTRCTKQKLNFNDLNDQSALRSFREKFVVLSEASFALATSRLAGATRGVNSRVNAVNKCQKVHAWLCLRALVETR